ncbi:27572_t:CDS:2, partial [Racocetra persica]
DSSRKHSKSEEQGIYFSITSDEAAKNRLEFANGSSISHLISTFGSNMNGRASNSPLSIKEKHMFSGMDSHYKLEPGQRASHTNTQSIQ